MTQEFHEVSKTQQIHKTPPSLRSYNQEGQLRRGGSLLVLLQRISGFPLTLVVTHGGVGLWMLWHSLRCPCSCKYHLTHISSSQSYKLISPSSSSVFSVLFGRSLVFYQSDQVFVHTFPRKITQHRYAWLTRQKKVHSVTLRTMPEDLSPENKGRWPLSNPFPLHLMHG